MLSTTLEVMQNSTSLCSTVLSTDNTGKQILTTLL